ncbi:MAG: outer membrane beta-barrel protein [Saprospiraceae bacterium]
MKQILLLSFFVIQFGLFAQVTPPTPPPSAPAAPAPPEMPIVKKSDDQDTTRIRLKDREIIIINKKSTSEKTENDDDDDDDDKEDMEEQHGNKEHHAIHKENTSPAKKQQKAADVDFLDIDLGVNILRDPANISAMDDQYVNLKFWSWSATFNFLPTKIYLGTRHVQLMTSFGWRIGQYKFDNPLVFTPKENLNYSVDTNINKSSLTVHHLQIPLMLYVQSGKIKGLGRLGLGFGGYAGVNVHEESNVKYQHIDRKVETEESFGFERYRYGLSGRVDVGPFKLFANMDLSNTWKSKEFKTLECGLWFDF